MQKCVNIFVNVKIILRNISYVVKFFHVYFRQDMVVLVPQEIRSVLAMYSLTEQVRKYCFWYSTHAFTVQLIRSFIAFVNFTFHTSSFCI